jgi:serine/threonine-protein kinase RIO1
MEFGYENNKREKYSISDHTEESYYPLLLRLPRELLQKHLSIIEEEGLNTDEVKAYLNTVIERRSEAMTETLISDQRVQEMAAYPDLKKKILEMIETSVFQSPTIGEGQTAKIKRFEMESGDKKIPMAVKYLLTPTSKTLSAAAEHDMLREVERINTIEEIEQQTGVERIRVPHPYLHHKTEQIQCYAMELIDGADLRQVLEGEISDELLQQLTEAFAQLPEENIQKEFQKFITAVHTYCLHGDIKPANLMVSRQGTLYLIDFGQSVLVNDIYDTARAQLDNLKESEVEQIRTIIKLLYKKLFKNKH